MQTTGTPYEFPIQNITSYVPNVVISDTGMLIHISGPLWFPEVKWVTDPLRPAIFSDFRRLF